MRGSSGFRIDYWPTYISGPLFIFIQKAIRACLVLFCLRACLVFFVIIWTICKKKKQQKYIVFPKKHWPDCFLLGTSQKHEDHVVIYVRLLFAILIRSQQATACIALERKLWHHRRKVWLQLIAISFQEMDCYRGGVFFRLQNKDNLHLYKAKTTCIFAYGREHHILAAGIQPQVNLQQSLQCTG